MKKGCFLFRALEWRFCIHERIYFKRDFCQQAPLKMKIDTSRSRMMIIFEMEQLWCLVNTFQNFGQHVLTNCWPSLGYTSKYHQKWPKRQLLTKCEGVFAVGWVRHMTIGSKWAHGMCFDLQKILDPYLNYLRKYATWLLVKNVIFWQFWYFLGHFSLFQPNL